MKVCPFCAESIQDAAIVCKHCRRDLVSAYEQQQQNAAPVSSAAPPAKAAANRRKMAIGCATAFGIAVLVVLILAAIGAIIGPSPKSSQTTSGGGTLIVGGEAQKSGLTYANYLRLQEGMTYSEAVEILGSPGEEISRSDLAGYTTVMYQWKRWTGANMNAMFQNGKMVMKAQFGLDK